MNTMARFAWRMCGHSMGFGLSLICTSANAFVVAPLGAFVPEQPMAVAAYTHTATGLNDGRVLITTAQEAQVFDPNTETYSATGAMAAAHDVATATLLPDGRVLVAGGGWDAPYPAAETYDPQKNAFTAVGDLKQRRYGHEATRLQDGRVLITGGRALGSSTTPLTQAELFDPVINTFRNTGVQLAPRFGATVTLLQSGDVLIAGGTDGQGHVYYSAELYRAVTGTFVATGPMGSYRVYHAATLLADGSVVITGGFGSTTGPTAGNGTGQVLATAERYIPNTAVFVPMTALMTTTRQNHTSTIQRDGTVLLCGGEDDFDNVLPYADVFDPITQHFTRVAADMQTARTTHRATPLSDGRILITGGEVYNATYSKLVPTTATELFEPDHIFISAFD